MAKRLKITGFARFLLFLIIIVPIALVVSHMANNNWQFDQNKFLEDLNLKQNTELLDADVENNDSKPETEVISDVEATNPEPTQPTAPTTEDIERPDYVQNDSLEVMKNYIEDLESKLDDAKVEIDDLKNKLYQRDYLMNQIDSLQQVIEKRN